MNNAMDTGATVEPKPFSTEEIQAMMAKEAQRRADTMPWSKEWKFVWARRLLNESRDIMHTKKTLQVTKAWLLKVGLIKWVELRDNEDHFVAKVLRPTYV